jgi:hypothetical protein
MPSGPKISRRAADNAAPSLSAVPTPISTTGQALDATTRGFMEPRFGQNFDHVRIHADANAANSARSIHARAYTLGNDIVFGAGEYSPSTYAGRSLLAHELTHVVQQSEGGRLLQRQCLTGAAACPAEICGDPGVYDSRTDATEAPGRATRRAETLISPGTVTASGHGREATHVRDLVVASGITLSGIHGIFVDLDMASGAWTGLCRHFVGWVPPYSGPLGAECVFIPDSLEREAEAYLALPTSSRHAYDAWLRDMLNTLRHELQHIVHDRSTHAPIAGTTCTRHTVLYTSGGTTYTVDYYLSELSAILAEFPLVFDYARRHTAAGDYGQLLRNLQTLWRDNVFNCEESIRGIVTALKCHCPCSDVDAYLRDMLTFTSAGSTSSATIPGLPAWSSTTSGVFVDLMRSMFPTVGWP